MPVTYDFDSVHEYYDLRDENDVVGIIDKEVSRRKSKKKEEIGDIFKIRLKRPKVLTKMRKTGLSSFFEQVAAQDQLKIYLNI